MPRFRRDPTVKGLVYRPLWVWLNSGEPQTVESQRDQFSGLGYWLQWMFTSHWKHCTYCTGESTPERVNRLITVALNEGFIGLCDDIEVALDDGNTKAVIGCLDELEPAPDREWWTAHYGQCPTVLSWRLKQEATNER
jgi:hypothetical protein